MENYYKDNRQVLEQGNTDSIIYKVLLQTNKKKDKHHIGIDDSQESKSKFQ